MLSSSDEIAGKGALFLCVDDLPAERQSLRNLGIGLGSDNEGDYSMLAQVSEPDGNMITLHRDRQGPF